MKVIVVRMNFYDSSFNQRMQFNDALGHWKALFSVMYLRPVSVTFLDNNETFGQVYWFSSSFFCKSVSPMAWDDTSVSIMDFWPLLGNSSTGSLENPALMASKETFCICAGLDKWASLKFLINPMSGLATLSKVKSNLHRTFQIPRNYFSLLLSVRKGTLHTV